LQNQISAKAPTASPTFTGTVTIPTGASITNPTIAAATLSGTITNGGTISGGTISSSNISTPFGGTISVAPGGAFALGSAGEITANSTTVSATRVSYLSTLSSNVQDQINGKLTTPGAWTTSWVPTWSGTSSSATGATVTTAYSQVGKTVSFRINITYGTGNFGSAGVSFSTPSGLTPIATTVGQCISITGAGNRYGGEALINSSGTITPLATPATAGGASQLLTSSAPFSWGTTSQLIISGTYEVA
jgi:hypothetical protein